MGWLLPNMQHLLEEKNSAKPVWFKINTYPKSLLWKINLKVPSSGKKWWLLSFNLENALYGNLKNRKPLSIFLKATSKENLCLGEARLLHMTVLKGNSLWYLSLTHKLTLSRVSLPCSVGPSSDSHFSTGSCSGPRAPTDSFIEVVGKLGVFSVDHFISTQSQRTLDTAAFPCYERPNVDAAFGCKGWDTLWFCRISISRRL